MARERIDTTANASGNNIKEENMKDCDGKLAEGEMTGHAHRVKVAVMEREDGIRVFDGATDVTHEEHGGITLPKRRWNSDVVREYDHIADMERRAID